MKLPISIFLCTCFLGQPFLEAKEDKEVAIYLGRSDSIPLADEESDTDAYFEGYVQALIDMHYAEYRVIAIVKDKSVYLTNLPQNELLSQSIISFVRDIPGVGEVKILEEVPSQEMEERKKYVRRPTVSGIWFPQLTELFQPLVASPRQVTYSIGYRLGDEVIGKHTIAVALGDDFPIFRWLNVGPGDLQIGIESGIWSVFNVDVPPPNLNGGTELVNTDFYVGIPLTYAVYKWSFRFRLYHESSHLGDEFMVNHPDFRRLNPSMEVLDFFASYQAHQSLRLYVGTGAVIHSDHTFPIKPFFIDYGGEFRFGGQKFYYQRLYGTFFIAVYFRTWQQLGYDFDGTGVIGYEWSKLQGIGRKIRFFVEGHKGFSLEGQFFNERTAYVSFRMSYGF